MDIVTIYAIAAGGMLILIRVVSSLMSHINTISVLISKYLTYPYFLDRHRLFGPWTVANVLLYLAYGAVNIFFITFRVSSTGGAGRRAGTLSLINMGFLFIAAHLSLLQTSWVFLYRLAGGFIVLQDGQQAHF